MAYKGQCFCGAVQLQASGDPHAMGYCHCSSCRSWSAAPVTAFTLWPAQTVQITEGAEHVRTFQKTAFSERQYCTKCGGHLMTRHPTVGLIDVYAATLPGLKFTPALHVNYADSVLRIRDGLPKFKGFPPELGGSSEMLPE
ncbi:MAG TPA: GFA family protein [Micropepsaceae bacterium]|nr:GFA family protein [Micropepsaceae bacterium]